MDSGLLLVVVGALLVTSLLLRNAAAGHVTPEMVPTCLAGRLRLSNRLAPVMLALATAVLIGGIALLLTSQIATRV
ncbi:hypothetical protein [Nocardioides jensenii]|uniref:hypothetical protein n=1 Tax=Nocardioides jensenii TaxID=1843 RepID=UPI00082E8643|nr:hypothetical protein [Nocardioides jensenii]